MKNILSALALPLLRDGYSYKELAHIAKSSFVEAAESVSKDAKVRTSTANIAAITGLTRTEVSRLRKNDSTRDILAPATQSRGTKVAVGWISDAQFREVTGRPKALSIGGGRGSFFRLVKKYGGDIPARAMLDEMLRSKLVRREGTRVRLIRAKPETSRNTQATIQAMAPWMSLLSQPTAAPAESSITSTTLQRKIHFASMREVLSAVRELRERQRVFVSAIEHLGTQTEKDRGLELTVSLALAILEPKQARRKISRKDPLNAQRS